MMDNAENFVKSLDPFITEKSDFDREALVSFFKRLYHYGFNKKLWPYNYEDQGLFLKKLHIVQPSSKSENHDKKLNLSFHYINENNEDTIDFRVEYDKSLNDELSIKLNSMKKSGDLKIKNFSWDFVKRHKKLIDSVGDCKKNNKLFLDAYSSMNDDNVIGQYKGSLTWATRGFAFDDKSQSYISQLQNDFSKFLMKRKVFLSEKQKKSFIKPYHYACFRPDIGEKTMIENIGGCFEEKEVSLGKLFLIKECGLWSAVLSGGRESNDEYQFAKNFHSSKISREIAINKVNTQLGVNELNFGKNKQLSLNNLHNRFKMYTDFRNNRRI